MEKIRKEMVALFKKIQDVSDDYADVKEIFLDNSSMELLEDSIGVIKLLSNSRKAFVLTKFKFFIKGLNYECADKESLEKLIAYVDDKDKAEFITNSFDKVIIANSKLACSLMGLMLNDMVKSKQTVTQPDLTIMQALSTMNDYDVKNFHYLYKACDWGVGKTEIRGSSIVKVCDIISTTSENITYTVNLLERANLVTREGAVSTEPMEEYSEELITRYADVRYFNTLSRTLYKYTSLLFQK